MAVFVDPRSGKVYSNVPDEDAARARGEFGLVTEAEWQAQQTGDAADTKGAFGLIGEGFERGLGHVQDFARSAGWTPPIPGSDAFGPGSAPLAPPAEPAPLPAAGAETFPEAFSPEARIRSERHPILTGIGTGLAVAPAAGIAAAAGGALAPGAVPIVGGAVGALGAESAVEGLAQEWDDAWLEQRPFELKRAAANILLFGGGDMLLRGGGKLAGKALSTLTAPTSTQRLGARNVIAEAQARAGKAANRPATRSVGAASAQELNDPFDDAIGQMDEASAYTLARDFDDHSFLVARSMADNMTRLNNGLSESLGNQLKLRDFEIAADAWDGSMLERQQEWIDQLDGMGRDLVEAIELAPVDLGNHGKRVAADITQKLDQIAEAPTPARRLQLLDNFKKTLDRHVMRIAGDWQADAVARGDLLELLEPFTGVTKGERGFLRESLENPELFGHAADLQKALNKPWHEMLKSWQKVQSLLLEATGEKQFGVMGAGRNVMEGTVERARALIGRDPRELGEIRAHLGRVFDGYQGLIDARQAHGIVEKEGLPELEQSIRDLMEDWNLGATLGAAKAKAAHIQRNPRHWRRILDAVEGAPGIGGFLKGARQLHQIAGDLHLPKGTALSNVWDDGLRRYAKHPSLAESPVYASYSPWMQEALRTRGAPIPGPPGGGGGVGQVAKDVGTKVAGVGLIGLGANEANKPRDPNAPMQAGGGAAGAVAAGLSLLLGRRALRLGETLTPMPKGLDRGTKIALFDAESEMREAVRLGRDPNVEHYAQRLTAKGAPPEAVNYVRKVGDLAVENKKRVDALPAADKDWNWQRTGEQKDAVWKLHQAKREAAAALTPEERYALSEYVGNAYQRYRLVESEIPDDELMAEFNLPIQGIEEAKSSIPSLRSAGEKLAIEKPTQYGTLYRGMSVPDGALAELLSKDDFVTHSTASTSWDPDTAMSFALRDAHPVMLRINKLDGGGLAMNTTEEELLVPRGARFKVTGRSRGATQGGDQLIIIDLEQKGRANPKDLQDAGVLAAILGIGGAAAAATRAKDARAADRPVGPSPESGPATLYREAMRGINDGGTSVVRQKASAALRRTPPRGRPPLRAFTGRRSLDAAVDDARAALSELQGDPSALVETLAANLGDLPRTHPSVYMALTEKATQIVGYLSARAPQRVGQTLLDPEGFPPSQDRSLDFAYEVVGATMPEQAMGDIARLDIPPEELASFQANWPELWEPYRLELLGQTMRRAEAGRPVDAEKLRQLDALLGMNGQLDPSGSAEVAQHMLTSQEQTPEAPASNSPPTRAPSATGRSASLFRTRLGVAAMENQIG